MNLHLSCHAVLGGFVAVALAASAQSGTPEVRPVATVPPAPSTTYNVNLSPVFKVGQLFHFVSDGSYAQEVTGFATDESKAVTYKIKPKIACHLEGDAEVLAVFPNGSIQKLSITVKDMRQRIEIVDIVRPEGQIQEREMFPAGTKLIEEITDQKTTLIVDGRPFTDRDGSIALLLRLFDAKPTNQEIFGPKISVAVGASWPLNSPAFLKLYDHWIISQGPANKDYPKIFKDATGTMKLESVSGRGDDQVSTVSGEITVDVIALPLPLSGIIFDSKSVKVTRNDVVPSTTKGKLTRTMVTSVKIDGHVSNKTNIGKVNVLWESSQSQVITFK